MAKASNTEIPEAKIRQVIWYLKTGKTKKFCCEHLSIPYSPKKLDTIIEEFHAKIEREAELKKVARVKVFSDKEKQQIAKQYLGGAAQSTLAADYFISPQRIKNILIEMNVPIRGKGKKSETKVDHIEQDLETKFAKGDKVFSKRHNCFATIYHVYDEDYIDYLENCKQRYVEIYSFKPDKKGMSGPFFEPQEGIHFEIYYDLVDGSEIKKSALEMQRRKVLRILEETGREYYSIWRDDDDGCFYTVMREELYPVKG